MKQVLISLLSILLFSTYAIAQEDGGGEDELQMRPNPLENRGYNPVDPDDDKRQLLGHEITHVLQQRGVTPADDISARGQLPVPEDIDPVMAEQVMRVQEEQLKALGHFKKFSAPTQ